MKIQEAKTPTIDKLYEKLFTLKEMLLEVVTTANEVAADASTFGGEIARVIPNQMRVQLIPSVQQYIDSPQNPIAVDSVIRFLDSLPLSKVRAGRAESEASLEPVSVPAIGAQAAMGEQPIPPPSGEMTGLVPNAAPVVPGGYAESAILRAKGQPLLDKLREDWEAEHQEEPMNETALDFRAIKEGYKRNSTPEVFTRNDENKIYNRVVENAQKGKVKLEEADILAGPYAKSEVGDMSGWRDLVETHVIDETINERLGAAAVAEALVGGGSADKVKAGINRMKEIVSEPLPSQDAGDIADAFSSSDDDFGDEIVLPKKSNIIGDITGESGGIDPEENLAELVSNSEEL